MANLNKKTIHDIINFLNLQFINLLIKLLTFLNYSQKLRFANSFTNCIDPAQNGIKLVFYYCSVRADSLISPGQIFVLCLF